MNPELPPLTARDIQLRLMVGRYARNLVCPNYTPRQWFECDVFELTPSGLFHEYEIKVSRADFKIDSQKRKSDFDWGAKAYRPVKTKHERLADRDTQGPTEFWFVVPDGLVGIDDVPEWAGLMFASQSGMLPPHAVCLSTAKKAPRLHREKCDDKIESHCRGVFYWRFHHLLNRIPSRDFETGVEGDYQI